MTNHSNPKLRKKNPELRWIIIDGKHFPELRCPACGKWQMLDDAQLHGRAKGICGLCQKFFKKQDYSSYLPKKRLSKTQLKLRKAIEEMFRKKADMREKDKALYLHELAWDKTITQLITLFKKEMKSIIGAKEKLQRPLAGSPKSAMRYYIGWGRNQLRQKQTKLLEERVK